MSELCNDLKNIGVTNSIYKNISKKLSLDKVTKLNIFLIDRLKI